MEKDPSLEPKNTEKEKRNLRDFLYGESNVTSSSEEILRVEKLCEKEIEWWKDVPVYDNLKQIKEDIKNGILVKVESDKNIKLIMRLENGEFEEWPPYLHKETAVILKNIGEKWREKMKEAKLSDNIQLAITSLIRTSEYQEDLIKRGKLGIKNSTHTKGQAFDIDGCGYYLNNNSINPRQCKEYKKEYDPRVHEIFKKVLEEMQSQELLNYVLEFEGTDNQCFHIARNPKKNS